MTRPRYALSQKYILGMRILMLGIEHAGPERAKKLGNGKMDWLRDDQLSNLRLAGPGRERLQATKA